MMELSTVEELAAPYDQMRDEKTELAETILDVREAAVLRAIASAYNCLSVELRKLT